MRYEKGHREETRRRILDTAASRFRRDGIGGVGIKSLMGDVGLTHGGFYAHFPSRDGLVAEAVGEALGETLSTLKEAVERAKPGKTLDAFIDAYLSDVHRERMDRGCAGAALAPEVARQSAEARARFTAGLAAIVELLASQLPEGGTRKLRLERAYAVFGSMMGCLQLARAIDDPSLSASVLKSGRSAAGDIARRLW